MCAGIYSAYSGAPFTVTASSASLNTPGSTQTADRIGEIRKIGDVGWGGDIAKIREHLPRTFLNIRLDPVGITRQTPEEIRETILRLVG